MKPIRQRLAVTVLAMALVSVPAAVRPGVTIDRVIDLKTQSAAGEYALLFCPRKSAGSGPDVGHAFVVWVAEDPERCFSSAEAYGYYPKRDDAAGILRAVVGPVPGELRREMVEGKAMRGILEVKLDEAAYRRSEVARERWEVSHQYQLGISDCASFLITVAQAAGLVLPPRWQAVPPHVVIEKLVALNGAEVPGPQGRIAVGGGGSGRATQAELARQTMDRMEAIAHALEAYRSVHGRLPEGPSGIEEPVREILGELRAGAAQPPEGVDGWGHPIFWQVSAGHYALVSVGADGVRDGTLRTLRPSESWDVDILSADGRFVTWPCDVPRSPEPAAPCWVADVGEGALYSLSYSPGVERPAPGQDLGEAAGAGAADLLTGFAQDVIFNGARAGVHPAGAVVSAVVTYLQRKADRLVDPVTLMPVTDGFRVPEDPHRLELQWGPNDTVLPVVFLDLLRVRGNGSAIDPGRFSTPLRLQVLSAANRFEVLDDRILLTVDQLQHLRSDRSYYFAPYRGLDPRMWADACTRCRLTSGHPLEGVCQAGTAIAKPGHGRSEKVALDLGGHREESAMRPGSRLVLHRSETVQATHRDQGVGVLAVGRGGSQAPGAVRLPRKSSSSAGRVHDIGEQACGCPAGLQHSLAHDRRTGPSPGERLRGGSNQAFWFVQAPILASSPAHNRQYLLLPVLLDLLDRTKSFALLHVGRHSFDEDGRALPRKRHWVPGGREEEMVWPRSSGFVAGAGS